MFAGIAGAVAEWYGYKTFGSLLRENMGLIIILIAFICLTLVFLRMLKSKFPTQGKEPGKFFLYKVIIVFMICAFVFLSTFTLFYEKKKLDKEQAEQSALSVYRVDYPA